MKFSVQDFIGKCNQIHKKLVINNISFVANSLQVCNISAENLCVLI